MTARDGLSAPPEEGPLDGLRVLDLGGLPTAYCTRLLADFGADVLLIEPPAGDPLRALPPFAGDAPGPERSLVALALHTNKRSVVLDYTTPEGREMLLRLVRTADAVVEGFQPGYLAGLGLGYAELRQENPRTVLCSITPFGQTGPYAGYKGLDLHVEAMAGLMMGQGDPAKPPCFSPAFLGYALPGIHAALGIQHALFAREQTGRGQHVDVSMQEVTANIALYNYIAAYGMTGSIAERPGDHMYGGVSAYHCKDGEALVAALTPQQYMALAELTGNAALQDPLFEQRRLRQDNADFINGLIQEFASQFTVQEFVEEAQRRRIPTAPLNTPGQVTRDRHFLARSFFVSAGHPVVGDHTLPGPPGWLSGTPWRIYRPAPALGQHTQEVLADLARSNRGRQPIPPRPRAAERARLPLEGVRITDLTRALVGPYGTRQLADFGAEAIKVESSLYDVMTRTQVTSPTFPEMNRNKLSITVDLHTREGQEIVKRLVAVSDAVAENYAPGALQRWGLDYESLRQVKSDIVYLSVSGFGQSGPYSPYVSWGRQATAASGLAYLWGHGDSPPSRRCGIDYADNFVGSLAALMLEMALYHRRRTGRGQFIEVSMAEGMANAAAVPFLDYFVNGREGEATGNHRPYAVPHNVYSCKGLDAWCAIACATDQEWRALGRALTPVDGQPPAWTQDERFATLAGRLAHREEIDEHLAEWTRGLTPRQVMLLLQKQGVPASAVQTNEDLYFDRHLRARDYIVPIDHAEERWKGAEHPAIPVRLSETPGIIRRGSPALGQHNQEIVGELLGLSAAEIRDLQEAKVLV